MTGLASLEFFGVVASVAPIDGGFRHIFLRCQGNRMGFMASCTDRNALLVFPAVRHIAVGIYLFAAFCGEVVGCASKIIEGTVTLKADILVPRWDRRSLRLLLRPRRPGWSQRCFKKINEYKNQEEPGGHQFRHGNILSPGPIAGRSAGEIHSRTDRPADIILRGVRMRDAIPIDSVST